MALEICEREWHDGMMANVAIEFSRLGNCQLGLGQRAKTAGAGRGLAHVIYRLFLPSPIYFSISLFFLLSSYLLPLASSSSDLLHMRCVSFRTSPTTRTN